MDDSVRATAEERRRDAWERWMEQHAESADRAGLAGLMGWGAGPGADEMLEAAERGVALRGALQRLVRRERCAIAMRFGLSTSCLCGVQPSPSTYREIGAHLGISSSSARRVVKRAEQRVARLMLARAGS